MELEAGDLLGGRYRLLQQLGQGGMGAVYLAEDVKLPGKRWAVKRISLNAYSPDQSGSPNEASLLLQLSHPFLPHIVDVFPSEALSDNPTAYIVMEYIEGETLQAWLDRQPGLPPVEQVLDIGQQVCALLHFLHTQRPEPIVYRDLKPANLMLDRQFKIRLIDFGIARSFKPGQPADTVPLGTVAFAAPEQLSHAQTDPRSDLYSLGAMLYYCLSGGLYYAVASKPLHQLRSGLPDELTEAVHRLLEHDPGDRFQTAEEAGRALARVWVQHVQATEAESHMAAASIYSTVNTTRITPIDPVQVRMAAGPDRKLIVVGALYAGAGATFTSIALARGSTRLGVPMAVIEAGGKDPELGHLLRLSQYVRTEELSPKLHVTPPQGFVQGGTHWFPLPAGGGFDPMCNPHILQMLRHCEETKVLFDISDMWTDPDVRALCQAADELVVVLDPFPSKWQGGRAAHNMQALREFADQGRIVHWVMNKDAPHPRRRERMNRAPDKPIAIVPSIPTEQILQAFDRGKLPHDLPGVRDSLDAALMPLLQRLTVSDGRKGKKGRLRFSFWSFF